MSPTYYVTPEQLKRVTDFLNKYQIGGGVWGVREDWFVGPYTVPRIEGKELVVIALNQTNPTEDGITEFDNHRMVLAGLVNRRLDLYGEETAAAMMKAQ